MLRCVLTQPSHFAPMGSRRNDMFHVQAACSVPCAVRTPPTGHPGAHVLQDHTHKAQLAAHVLPSLQDQAHKAQLAKQLAEHLTQHSTTTSGEEVRSLEQIHAYLYSGIHEHIHAHIQTQCTRTNCFTVHSSVLVHSCVRVRARTDVRLHANEEHSHNTPTH